MDSGLAGDGEVAVLAAGEGGAFAIGELQVLPGDGGEVGAGGLDQGGVGQVGEFAVTGGDVLLTGIGHRLGLVGTIDHATGDDVQGFERGGLVVDGALVGAEAADSDGEFHRLVSASGLG